MKNNICLFFLIVQAFLYAQDNTPPQLPKIFPPSPDVASLGKFGDIPVGYYTGVPNISVPMVTLQGKELSIPVSIAYHAGGVKVNEIASRVGIGWAINAGGAISRSTRGIPDDKGMGYLYNTAHINYLLSNPSAVDDPQAKGYLETVSQGNEDLESDIYNYNFMGYSGKFFFNNTGEIIMHPYDNVRFTPVKNGLTIIGWKAVVKDGTIFYLGVSKDGLRKANDTSTTSTMSQIGGTSFSLPFMNPNFTDFITTWQLMDIETTKGELVSYEYGSNAIEFWSLASQTNILKSSIGQMPTGFARPLTFSSNSDVTHRIVKIKNDLGYINFEYNLARVDLKNDVALTAVKLFDNSNTLIDQYNLNYDYFVATQLQGLSGFNMEDLDQRKYRLYLKNVTQSKNNLTNNKYEFTYNTAQQLPDRLSYSQDFWGYYNGQPNSFYYPSIQYVPVDGNSPDLSEDNNTIVTSQGGNRKVYPDYAKACILTKIKYPTGGTTEFEFESNRVIGDKNWLITTTEPEMVSVYGFMSYTAPPGEVQLNIPIPNPEKYIGGLTLSYNLLHNCSNSNAFDCPKIRIYKANNIDFTDVFISTTSIYGEKKIDLAPGQTSLRIEVSGYGIGIAGNPINHINFSINGHKLKPEDENGALAGGLRVRRIINKNTDQTTLTQKRYEYNQFDNPTKSSGLGMNLPVFMAYSKLMQIIVNPNNVQYIYANIINANPIFSLTNGSSYSAGYTNVTEYSEGAGSQGKTEYTFMFMADPNTGNVFKEYSLQAPTTDYSHRRGALLKKSVFLSNNSTYKLLQETINEYVGTDYGNNTSTNLVSENISNIKFNLKQYNNLAAPFYKIKETTNNYSGAAILTQTKDFFYDNPVHLEPTRITTTDSKGNTYRTKMIYADDIPSPTFLAGPALTNEEWYAVYTMKSNALHRIAEPIQTETTMNDAATFSVQRTAFQNWGNDLILPKKILVSKGDLEIENRIAYNAYDSKGNPQELQQEKGTPIVYLWGYNKSLPIAKIENATAAQVATALGTDINGLQNYNETHIGTLNNLRNSLAEAMVTTYSYIPQVGIRTITDPKGQTTTYEYDTFNRLQKIKDFQGNVIKENQYNYAPN